MKGSVVVSATVPAEPPPGGGGGGSGGPAVVAGAGSRLSVNLMARRSALGGSGAEFVSVGRLSKPVRAGKRSFSVRLRGAAKRAVADAGRLAVTVRFKLKPASGAAFTATRAVVVKPAA